MNGYAFAAAAAVLWGLAGPAAKYLFHHGVSPLALTQMRQTISFFLLLAMFLIVRREHLRIRLNDLYFFVILGIGGLAMVQISYYSAMSRIEVASAILLQYMSPVFILLYSSIFLKERITRTKMISSFLAVSGCALVAGIYNVDFLKLNMAGVSWGLFSAVCFSFYTLYGQSGLKKYTPATLFTYSCGFGAAFWWIINPPRAFFSISYSYSTWIIFLYIAVFGTILPFLFYLKALEKMEASLVSITSTLEPVVAGVAAFFIIGEKMDLLQLGGAIMVLAGILLLQQTRSSSPILSAVQNN